MSLRGLRDASGRPDTAAVGLLTSAYGTAIAQHMRIHKDARDCGLWD